jgi:hypothetical protein
MSVLASTKEKEKKKVNPSILSTLNGLQPGHKRNRERDTVAWLTIHVERILKVTKKSGN